MANIARTPVYSYIFPGQGTQKVAWGVRYSNGRLPQEKFSARLMTASAFTFRT